MTEEEKAAFLNNALTRTLPKEKPRGPPIRQKIPGMDIADASRKDSQKDKDISVTSLMMDGKMKNEEAKRRYMESITNPDRFATFSTYQQSASTEEKAEEIDWVDETIDEEGEWEVEGEAAGEEETVLESVSDVADASADFSQMKRQIAEDRELLNPSNSRTIMQPGMQWNPSYP